MNDPARTRGHNEVGAAGERLRDQPLLPLPSASVANNPATLSTAIQTTLPAARSDRDTPERRFVRGVLARYVWLPDTPVRTSRYDRRLATTWFERGVALLVVEAALLLAGARRALRGSGLAPLPQVRSLYYFQGAVAEVLDNPCAPDLEYLGYLLDKLRPLAEVKLARLRHQELYGSELAGPADDPFRTGDSRRLLRRTR